MVTQEQFINGIIRYTDAEIVSKISGLSKWMVSIGIGAYVAKIPDMIAKNRDMLISAEYIHQDGMICIDKLYGDLMNTVRKTGNVTQYIPLAGDMTFSENDVSTLYRYITGT